VQLVHRELKATRVRMVPMALKVHKVCKARLVQLDQKVTPVQLVLKVHKDQKVIPALQDQLEQSL
jgi:hypothetical protein